MESSAHISCPVLVLVGPTAIGKTSLSLNIAEKMGCEIISMDSMQVYRYMDIGTAKPCQSERKGIPHHLLDIVLPDEQYHAARFVNDALIAIRTIEERGKIPLLTGGTGLYLDALVKGLFQVTPVDCRVKNKLRAVLEKKGKAALHEDLCRVDPASSTRIHVNDTQRLLRALEIFYSTGIPWSVHLQQQAEGQERSRVHFSRLLQIGLTMNREDLYERIALRTGLMLSQGLADEVEDLLHRGYTADLSSMQSIGYRHMCNWIQGKWDKEKMIEMLIRDTRRYAKRQFTWFGRKSNLEWYQSTDQRTITNRIQSFLQ